MVSFKWDWNRAMELRAEETADARTTEFVLNMLREHEPYEKFPVSPQHPWRMSSALPRRTILLTANTYTLAQHEKHRLNRPVLFNNQ